MAITDFWTAKGGKLVLYKRSGECNRCGECCGRSMIVYQMEVGFHTRDKHEEGEEGTKTVGWDMREGWNMFLAQGIWWYFQVDVAPLGEEGEGTCGSLKEGNVCARWQDNTFRPICRYWPFHPDHVARFPGCSFKFEEVKDD